MNTPAYEVAHVLFKRKRLIALAFVVVFGPSLFAALARPSVYRSASRLMITQARAYPQLSPQPERRNVPVNDAQFIAAAAQTLRTHTFLREAGEAIASAGNGRTNGDSTRSAAWWARHLLRRLEVMPLSNAPLIEVAYRADAPDRAANIVNTVVERFVDYQARAIFDSPALRQFYERRREEMERELAQAERALVEFQDVNDIFALETQTTQLARSHTEALQELDLNAGQIRQAETEAKALVGQLEKLPAQIALHTYGDSPRLNALHNKVVDLELELNDLRQLYTDEDRRIKDKLQELAQAEEMLMAEQAMIGDSPTTTRLESNDAYQNILENALREEASAEAMRARRVEIERRVEAATVRLEALNRVGYEYQRLKADLSARQASYTQLLTLLEQSRASEAMDKEGLTNVRIVDRATVPTRPVPNRRWLTLAMGLLASLAVGIGGAFGVEALSPTVHGQHDGEQRLALPVLGVIPEDV